MQQHKRGKEAIVITIIFVIIMTIAKMLKHYFHL
jgi:hypothetical protein